mgnify:CR=1 FL=1
MPNPTMPLARMTHVSDVLVSVWEMDGDQGEQIFSRDVESILREVGELLLPVDAAARRIDDDCVGFHLFDAGSVDQMACPGG